MAAEKGPTSSRPRRARAYAWLDDRLGLSLASRLLFDEAIPGGARWGYAFGAVAAALLLLEGVTGLLLAAFYAPTVSAAWASTAFIQDSLAGGWFVRGLHSFGASALILLTLCHVLQVVWAGAYRAPRELNWLVGLGLMGLLLLFALSGYGLPWDEKGYWAKQVEAGIVGGMPLIGPPLRRFFQGGDGFGNYTLTHFYALHAMVLPAVTVTGVGLHLWMVRRHGHTPPAGWSETDLARRAQPYFPHQAARDSAATAAVLVLLCLLTVGQKGAALEGPADPSASYQARPEWYSLALYELRHLVPAAWDVLATVVLPGLFFLALAALPWLDRGPSRRPRDRWAVLATSAAGLLALACFTYLPLKADAVDPGYQQARAEVQERARRARRLAQSGVLPEGGVAVYRNDPQWRPRELWKEHCAGCHTLLGRVGPETGKETGQGEDKTTGDKGPDFKGYNSRAWIRGFLRAPNGPLFMGPAHLEQGMKPVVGSDEELAALTELVYAETGAQDVDTALVRRAEELWSQKDCDSCHDRDGTAENTGPNLKGRGRKGWIESVIADAGHPLIFGARNKMPRFADKLSPEDVSLVATFLLDEARPKDKGTEETPR